MAVPARPGELALFRTMGPRLPLTSNIKIHTSNSSYFYTPPPITRRVAGICTEKWIALCSETAVSPCPDANKENLSAGPFSVLDCCTNRNITVVFGGQGLPMLRERLTLRSLAPFWAY